jgi:hypothetical protein
MHPSTETHRPAEAISPAQPGPARAALLAVMAFLVAAQLAAAKALARPNETRRALQLRGLRRGGELDADVDEQGNVITDNLAWIVFGVLAIVVIGGAISGLCTAVINWVTKQLNV